MTIRLKDLLESSGDFAGAPGFQGGPFGFGGNRQLAKPVWAPGLEDRDDERPDVPVTPDEDYDDHPHLLPHEDQTLRAESIENDPARSNYSDYRGFPAMNTLAVDPRDEERDGHVPLDKDLDRDFPEPNRFTRDHTRLKLVPDGKDDAKPEYWGTGPLDPMDGPNHTTLPKRKFEETLNLQGNPSVNNWKTTTRQNMGKADPRNIKQTDLVAKKDFLGNLPADEMKRRNHLDDDDDVSTHLGGMGNLVAPQQHVPVNETKDEVEEALDSLGPWRGSKHTLVGQEDFTINLEQLIREAVVEALQEKAPPGMEDVVMALKKKYGENNPKVFAIAWAQYNKGLKETHVGFNKLKDKLARRGVEDPGAVAAAIGRKKYGIEKMKKAAKRGKPLSDKQAK